MQVTFLGGADEVGASCTLVEMGGKRLLIDAGIRISPRSNRGIQNSQLPDLRPISETGGPDYILVTHAHTDHTGALPLVVEQYPRVPVLMTRPTVALVRTLQKDAQHIMKSRHEEEGELPLFDQVSVDALMDAIQEVEFNQPIKLGESLQVTYHVAGHIAGAAMLVLESEEGTLVMSGDVSLSEQRTVNSLNVPRIKADALVLESTYGGKLHAERRGEELRMIEMLKQIIERGGKVLIPAFALGRAQEVIQIILAYRDQLDVPVYVDGMVRSVCDSYNRFSDLLPEKTVRAAGDEHLFFRSKIHPIRSTDERARVANSPTPLIVVASSGMLTGGASVAYAKAFAPDERNAILLTGYQDEEAPGRFLQRVMKERNEGDTPNLRLGKDTVKLRCDVGTYSLSAHADEQELVNVALALKPSEVMLVHGDHGARHSIATALRRRQFVVTTPKIGTVRSFSFKKKPWAVGTKLQSGSQTGELDPAQLWESLKNHVGDYYSARELAQVWWGDGERAPDVVRALEHDTVYFSADWRAKNTFQVRSSEQIAKSLKDRNVMLAYPDIIGKLVLLRNSNDQPRLGVVRKATENAFEADVHNTRGRHFPGRSILWVIGDWQRDPEGKSTKGQLSALMKEARIHTDMILPFDKRLKLVNASQPVNPEALIPDLLPDGIDSKTALISIVLAMARDGATLDLEHPGLVPQRAMAHGPLEQNEAREIAMKAFPPEARLRKAGMDIHRKRLYLSFDFPDPIIEKYDDTIEQLIDQTGWDVQIKRTVNQQALSAAVDEVLPEGGYLVKGPSLYMDRGEVHIQVEGMDTEEISDAASDYEDLTGYRLVINAASSSPETTTQTDLSASGGGEKMEINAAYGVIRRALGPFGLNKTSLKQGGIVLAFISPQVGERHMESIASLAKETGYRLSIHPHPNQHQILTVVQRILREAGWVVQKGPGLHTDRAEISVKLAEEPDEKTLTQVQERLQEETGYKLLVE